MIYLIWHAYVIIFLCSWLCARIVLFETDVVCIKTAYMTFYMNKQEEKKKTLSYVLLNKRKNENVCRS